MKTKWDGSTMYATFDSGRKYKISPVPVIGETIQEMIEGEITIPFDSNDLPADVLNEIIQFYDEFCKYDPLDKLLEGIRSAKKSFSKKSEGA